jgi:hypothetical protein
LSSDRQLAQRIAIGEREAFAHFVDAYGPRVHRLAARYTANSADAEDLTQEIFLDMYRCIGRLSWRIVARDVGLSCGDESLFKASGPHAHHVATRRT